MRSLRFSWRLSASEADRTYLIELDRRSEALPGAVNVNGSVVVGSFNGGGHDERE